MKEIQVIQGSRIFTGSDHGSICVFDWLEDTLERVDVAPMLGEGISALAIPEYFVLQFLEFITDSTSYYCPEKPEFYFGSTQGRVKLRKKGFVFGDSLRLIFASNFARCSFIIKEFIYFNYLIH